VLVHCGDFTMTGRLDEIAGFAAWLAPLPHRHKVVIAGNHDFGFERMPEAARATLGSVTYLEDAGCTIDGVTFYGSPYQPWFFDWAFNFPRDDDGSAARERWAMIPDGVDVLLTHGPPRDIRDAVARSGEHVGCPQLLARVRAIRPAIHAFGHIHEGYGTETSDGTQFVNASICDERYRVVNAPIVVDFPLR
jgi:predicted phosphodiesterase